MAQDDPLSELEAQLAELEAVYRGAPVGLAVMDRELRYRRVNDRLARIHGRAAAAHIGRTVEEMIPALSGQVVPAYRRILATGEAVEDVEVRGELPSDLGHEHCWRVNHRPVRNRLGEIFGIVTAMMDITDLRTANDEVHGDVERLVGAQRVASVGSWEWDILEDRVWWSDELYRLVQKEKGAYTPTLDGLYDLIHPEDRAGFRRQLDASLEHNEPYVTEVRVILDDGEVRVLHASAAMERTPEGQPARLIGTCQDITERRRAERARARRREDPGR